MLESPLRPPIAQAPLSVILLRLGTASDAAESVSAWQTYLATLERPFELILVDSGAADAEPNPVLAEVRRVAFDPLVGYGQALGATVRTAQHPLVVLATADGQCQPADLPRLLGVIDHVDLVIGCRGVPRPTFWWRALRWIARLFARIVVGLPGHPDPCTAGATPWRRRWLARWAFGVRLQDPECPFRLGRRDALARIALQSHGPFVLVEQIAKANHLELIMAEEPIAWLPPNIAPIEAVPFAQEAKSLFQRPDFGPKELHVPVAAPPAAPPADLPEALPTKPASPSS